MYNGKKYNIFLCYRGSSEGGQLGSKLYSELKNYKCEDKYPFMPFFAPECIKKGDNFKTAASIVLQEVKIIIILLSKEFFSMCGNEDDVVTHELLCAFERPDIKFIPIVMPGFEYKNEDVAIKKVFGADQIDRFKHISAINYHGIYDFNLERDLVPTLVRCMENDVDLNCKNDNYFDISTYTRTKGEIITFGRYPQSVISDIGIIDRLSDGIFSHELEIDQRTKWIILNENFYSVTKEDPFNKNSFNSGKNISAGNRNYYLVEPIRWRVMYEDENSLIAISLNLLDAIPFNYSREEHMLIDGTRLPANNWEHSNIRRWLNTEFYNIAFDEYDKKKIFATTLDNSDKSAYFKKNNSIRTEDMVFLASHTEMEGFECGCAITSDYARARGAYSSTSSSHTGHGDWWLRSPGNVGAAVENVDRRGVCNLPPFCNYVDDTSASVRPVIHIKK